MTSLYIRVECREASHAPKIALVGRIQLEYHHGKPTVSLETKLDGDTVLDSKRLFGSANAGPDWDYYDQHTPSRSRATFTCPLCGLNVPMTDGKATVLAVGLQDAGVSSVSLAALAATLS